MGNWNPISIENAILKNFLRKWLFSALIFVHFSTGNAQTLEIKVVELQANGDVLIHYNLDDSQTERKYSIYVYTSQDNFIQPLQMVTGDVGVDIAVGGNKIVTWHAKEELGTDFKGGISLELKGSIYIPFISLDGFDDYKILKRGKPYDITWTGGRGDNILNFELYRGDTKIKVFEERPNVGNTSIVIPTDVKPGKYRFKISDSRNREEVVFTLDFQVRRKIPLALKGGVGFVIGGVVGYLATKTPPEEQKIGNPPLPEGN